MVCLQNKRLAQLEHNSTDDYKYELQISKKKIHIEISFSPTFLKQKKTSYQYKFLLKL